MNDWISQKAEEYNKKKQDRDYRESAVNLSNYWLELRQQIEIDVNKINAVEGWRDQVGEHPIKIKNEDEGYSIEKAQYPFVKLYLENQGSEILVRIEEKKSAGHSVDESEDYFNVVVEGRHVILKRFKEEFIVPEQASQRILKPIVDSILESIEQKARGASW